jgi:hypothetical protein
MTSAATFDDTIQLIRAEYSELPYLRLTVPQAARLWNLDLSEAKAHLDALADACVLERTPDGRYRRVGQG